MMNTNLKLKSIVAMFAISLFVVSCSSDDNDDLVVDPGSDFDGELVVSEAGNDARTISFDAAGSAKVKVTFSTTTESMRRLYITQDVGGAGEEPFQFTAQEVDEKPDGSLDLVGDDKKDFEFSITLPAPTMDDVTVVYKLWATTGRGDFRDTTKRSAFPDNAVGTITIKYGQGGNTGTGINSFTQTILAAPLGDGSSETFISLYNNEVYKINAGEETAALWDFGYYYGFTQNASLASTSDYPSNIIDVPTVSGLTAAELNKFYITNSSIDFDAVAGASDLDGIIQPTTERVTGLSVDDVLEFVDQYGNKGVIKVIEISGTDGTGDFIKLDIKVQV